MALGDIPGGTCDPNTVQGCPHGYTTGFNHADPFQGLPTPDFNHLWGIVANPYFKAVFDGASTAWMRLMSDNWGWIVMCVMLTIAFIVWKRLHRTLAPGELLAGNDEFGRKY